jgi:hypothetical protein
MTEETKKPEPKEAWQEEGFLLQRGALLCIGFHPEQTFTMNVAADVSRVEVNCSAVVYVNEIECWPNCATEVDVAGTVDVRASDSVGSFELRGLPVPVVQQVE